MDKTSIIGLILGLIAVGVGMVLKGVGVTALINPAALLIIILGTVAAVTIAFPTSTLKNVPTLFKILFTETNKTNTRELVEMFSSWADQTRREGILSLEEQVNEVEDPFLASGLQLAIDGQSPDFIKDIMLEKISAMEQRHEEGAAVFTQAGTYAPTLGVLGAVIGLIAALGDMSNMEALGAAISAAFIATLLGIFTGYVLWHPFANKLREKSKKEVLQKEIMVEGILSITTGDSQLIVREKLGSLLSSKELAAMKQVNSDE
ncbi:flagellar motor stator protein MotA [Oceanobacillus profundus]|uniref:Flagellar motor protein MotA n=1 Tax=Oceanobacillus profundus TaxID=372463 RepID=A0A417Y9Z0_9BACI|nr:flagellar motor stator protein MotA [Oceanobacillus profundus]MBR3117921.1 flagellar motor stator protein MotA [Oceanobacillus sp.]PAE28763.1 flagellar motor protein MotA [Paenibacillus sp. 7884-2]MCM3397342.1 flagellar motor stator protein MotA [Oceanobacillus profundus]MDO6451531.1 flagellar motor stator protein MotA [Oceanobacillus profundus]RHW29381.1 flagellar motor protein MotA [Oceanobacillus profundus]